MPEIVITEDMLKNVIVASDIVLPVLTEEQLANVTVTNDIILPVISPDSVVTDNKEWYN